MSSLIIYISGVLGFVGSIMVVWLSFVAMDKSIITTDAINWEKPQKIAVYGHISTGLSRRGTIKTSIINVDEWREVTAKHDGFDAVPSWWQLFSVIAMAGSVIG